MIKFELPSKEQYQFLSTYFRGLSKESIFIQPTTKQKHPIYTYVWYENNVMVGVIRAFLRSDGLLISYMAVSESMRGCGIGRKLVIQMLNLTVGSTIKTVMANTRDHNTHMISILGSLDFKQSPGDKPYENGDRKIHHTYEANSSS